MEWTTENWGMKYWAFHRDFLNKTNELIDKFAPFRKINNYKLKLTSKPWITPGLQKSISVKNDHTIKAELHLKYIETIWHINLLSILLKSIKQNYYKTF